MQIVLQLFLNISDAIQKTEQLLSAEEAAGCAILFCFVFFFFF